MCYSCCLLNRVDGYHFHETILYDIMKNILKNNMADVLVFSGNKALRETAFRKQHTLH